MEFSLGFRSAVYLLLLLLLQAFFFVFLSTAEEPDTRFLLSSNGTWGQRHTKGYCSMYNICGARSDERVLNCPFGSPAVKPDDLLSSKIQSLCPTITGDVCCTEAQFNTLRSQVQQAIPLLVGCPACLRNFLNLFCEMACSPDQSLFINVSSVSTVNGSLTVDGIEYYITDTFGKGLYESCKDVKFGTMNTRAMDFIGAGAKTFGEWFTFIGRKVGLNVPGSPYQVDFKPVAPESSGVIPMNVSAYSCGDTSLGCSCGDCPASSVCSSSTPPTLRKEGSCSVNIGSLRARCIDFSMTIIYIISISLFISWNLLYQRRKLKSASTTKPFMNAVSTEEFPTVSPQKDVHQQKDTTIRMQMFEDFRQTRKGVQLSIVQEYISKFYRMYGAWVARHPALLLSVSLAIILLLCLGLIRFKVETRPEKLWVGPGSRAAKEKQFFDSHLAPFYRIEQLILATIPDGVNGKPSTIVTENNIKLLFEIQKRVDGIRANHSGSLVSLNDICLKPLGQDCATQSVLQYFKMEPSNYDNFGGLQHVEYCFQHYTSTDTCMSAFKAPLDPSTALGGFSGNNYSQASAFIVTYPVNNGVDKESNESKKAVAWEKAFVQLAKDELLAMAQSKHLTLAFSSESSIEEELKRESSADAITILISYLVMFGYISLTLGYTPRLTSFYISSKVLLGLSGVILVMLSVLGSVGFFSAMGIKSTLIIMEVIPFLVLAVGVDNMCILVHAVKRKPLDMPLEGRISEALVEVGPSITLASLSEVLAFAVGSFIPMPACRVFSMFAALAVLLDFLLQITAFVALIVFDFKRTESKRIDCFPCIKISGSHDDQIEGMTEQNPGLLSRYMKEIHAPFLGIWLVKIAVVSVFAGLTLASIALCPRIQPGLEQKIVLPKDSYLQGYFDNITEHLRIGPPVYFVLKNYNYSLESEQTDKLCSISHCDSNSLLNEIARASLVPESTYIAKPAASWLDDFLVWMSPEAFGCCRKFINGSYCPPNDQPPCCSSNNGNCGIGGVCKDCTTCFLHSDLQNGRPSTEQFKEKLPWFLDALPSSDCAKGGHGAYTSNVELEGYETGIIKASAFRTYHTPLNNQIDFVNSLRSAREFSSRVSHSLKMEIFPYSVFYMFFEQYLDIWRTALINLAIAIVMTYMPQDFRGTLIRQQRERSERNKLAEVDAVVNSGGSIRDRYTLLWRQQMDRRQQLAQLGSATGVYKTLVKYLVGVPQVLLDFIRQINDDEGPMDEQRRRYGPPLYSLTKMVLNICLFLALSLRRFETKKLQRQQITVLEEAVDVYTSEFERFVEFLGNDYREISISAGRTYEVFLTVDSINSYIAWDFSLIQGKMNMDIGFSLEYINPSGQKSMILPYKRYESDQGNFCTCMTGNYKLIWDNSYSTFFKKVLRVKVDCIPPVSDPVSSEAE